MMARVVVLLLLVFALGSFAQRPQIDPRERTPEFWNNMARETLDFAIQNKIKDWKAKNVILFLGDGMSYTTIAAARILKGQKAGRTGEETVFAMDKFTRMGMSKCYGVDHQISDSAGTATAFLCGIKANYATIGVNGRVERGDCEASKTNKAKSILAYAQDAEKSTGIISTSRVTHASIGATYAYSAERRWEVDSKLSEAAIMGGCPDIAAQLMGEVGQNMQVIMGGGRRYLTPNTTADPEAVDDMGAPKYGERADGRNIIEEWVASKRGETVTHVTNKVAFDAVDPTIVDNLIGIFEYSHMRYSPETEQGDEPTITEMTKKAINILKKNSNGYFLFVEGARIDHGHHDNYARLALEDTIEFDNAIKAAVDMTDDDDTMIIVTADHSVPLIMNSYATRGNPILGLGDYTDDDTPSELRNVSDIDFKPYTTLCYGNGPGYNMADHRADLTGVDTTGLYYKVTTAIPNQWVSHDGTDVPIFARGPQSHLFHTTHEQNYIYHVMKYAMCLDDYEDHPHCKRDSTSTAGVVIPSVVMVLVAVAAAVFRF